MVREPARTAAVVAAALLAAVLPVVSTATPALADQRTVSGDTLRTAWDSAEPTLSPASVASSDFGPLFDAAVDGQVYAQPLVQDASVLVTTEKAKAYSLGRTTGAVQWSRSFGAPFQATTVSCGDLVPDLGQTSTGVIDPATRTWYFTTKLAVGNSDGAWWLQGVSIDTGEDRAGFPVQIQGTPTNDPSTSFPAKTQHQRPGLLLLGGVVYAAFGAHCDVQPFKGYVVGVSTVTHAVSAMWTTAVGAGLSGGGIWQAGGGIVSDGADRIFVSTGNGFFGGSQSGTPGLLAESVVRLKVQPGGALVTDDWFTPANAPVLDGNDTDLGSGAPTALPASFGTPAHPRLMLVEGKDGRMFVLDRDNLGGYARGPGSTDSVVSTTANVGPLWGHPAFFGAGGGYAYVAPTGQPLKALAYGIDGNGTPRMTVVASSTGTFGYTSGSPVVTSNGSDVSSGLVWLLYSSGPTGADGELRAYDAHPSQGLLTLRYHAAVGTVSKFSQPATDGGVVYVGTRDGHVLAFGRPQARALASSPVELGSTPVGSTVTATAILTASTPLTIRGITAAAPFSVTTPGLPVSLAAGGAVSLPVAFSPSSAGDAVGQVVVTTDIGTFRTGLHGVATVDGLSASPPTIGFGNQPTGLPRSLSVVVYNTGATDTHVTGVTSPTGSFSLSGPPAIGTTIHPGASTTIGVTFAPVAVGAESGSFVVSSSTGSVTVALSGTAVQGQSEMSLTPTTIDFGEVPVGLTLSSSFVVSNIGNLPLAITKAKAPTAPFTSDSPLAEGTVIGDVPYTQDVRFSPSQAGFFTGYYEVTGDDNTGAHYVILHGHATTPVVLSAPSPVVGGWALNGVSHVQGNDLVLTSGAANTAGNAVYPRQVASKSLYVRFRTTIRGGGAGAEGIALGLLDPATQNPGSIGETGAGLGVSGLRGVAVTADTRRSSSLEPTAPFAGIVTDTSRFPATLRYAKTAVVAGGLRNASRGFTVTYVNGVLSVYVDGRLATSSVVALPPSVLVAFSASTGALADTQSVRDVVIGRVPVTDVIAGTRGWKLNGGAASRGSWTTLTTAVRGRAGSAVRAAPVSTAELTASFTVALGGGTGGDGMSFGLLDPVYRPTSAVGGKGAALGAGGVAGTFVTFDTRKDTGQPSANFVGVATSTRGGRLHYLATTTRVPNLRRGSHAVVVRTFAGHLLVQVDGRLVLDVVVPVPPVACLSFSASTGTKTDAHRVARVSVRAVRTTTGSAVAGSAWTRNGSAVAVAGAVRLTAAAKGQRGTVLSNAVYASSGLRLRYVATISSGAGADGMALALVPSSVPASSVGAAGGGVGWSGLGGVAVVSDTFANAGDPGRDFVGVTTGTRGPSDLLSYVATSPAGRHLTTGSHLIDVAYVGGRLYVWVDGLPCLSPRVTLPALVRAGFTASTGSSVDAHTVGSVSFTSW